MANTVETKTTRLDKDLKPIQVDTNQINENPEEVTAYGIYQETKVYGIIPVGKKFIQYVFKKGDKEYSFDQIYLKKSLLKTVRM